MNQKKIGYILANFGGPRSLEEVYPFLKELLTDPDVITPKVPRLIHRLFFSYIAKKRSKKASYQYAEIGGKSPIYFDTEIIAQKLQKILLSPVLTFHRYLPSTHEAFIDNVTSIACDEWRIFPLFPQFTYVTTGSCARWFQDHLPDSILNHFRWVKSYPAHPSFINAHRKNIENFLKKHELMQEDILFLFSAHGIPKEYAEKGDIYPSECELSYSHLINHFPKAKSILCYQSRFGRQEWIKPYTENICKKIKILNQGRKTIVFVPISFTSDHIETLYEIEKEYLPLINNQGLKAYRVPCLNLNEEWIQAIGNILTDMNLCGNQMLIKKK